METAKAMEAERSFERLTCLRRLAKDYAHSNISRIDYSRGGLDHNFRRRLFRRLVA